MASILTGGDPNAIDLDDDQVRLRLTLGLGSELTYRCEACDLRPPLQGAFQRSMMSSVAFVYLTAFVDNKCV